MKISANDQIIYRIDEIDACVVEEFDKMTSDERAYFAKEEADALIMSPNVEFKSLPLSLHYEFLGPNETYPVIVNADLNSA
jgi:hypothetical protein